MKPLRSWYADGISWTPELRVSPLPPWSHCLTANSRLRRPRFARDLFGSVRVRLEGFQLKVFSHIKVTIGIGISVSRTSHHEYGEAAAKQLLLVSMVTKVTTVTITNLGRRCLTTIKAFGTLASLVYTLVGSFGSWINVTNLYFCSHFSRAGQSALKNYLHTR